MGKYIALALALLIGALGVAIAFQDYLLAEFVLKPDAPFSEQAPPVQPDYALAQSWAAHPLLAASNHGMKQPGGGLAIGGPRGADVFFVHPTSYLAGARWNAPIDDEQVNWNTDSFPMAQQLSAFAQCCALYAPRYRQAGLYSFVKATEDSAAALSLAYHDVLRAFDEFVATRDPQRPFVLAAHSQGSVHSLRLLQDRISGTPLAARLVAAYLPGYWMNEAMVGTAIPIEICATATQTGCLLTWDTYMTGGDRSAMAPQAGAYVDGAYRQSSESRGLCVNPVTGTRDGAANIDDHKGGIPLGPIAPPPGFGDDPEPYRDYQLPEIAARHVHAVCADDGTLMVTQPADPHFRSQTMPGNGLHVMDYGLFWADIQADVVSRLNAHLATSGR